MTKSVRGCFSKYSLCLVRIDEVDNRFLTASRTCAALIIENIGKSWVLSCEIHIMHDNLSCICWLVGHRLTQSLGEGARKSKIENSGFGATLWA